MRPVTSSDAAVNRPQALVLLVLLVMLVLLVWLTFGGNQINEPSHPVGPATLHACGGALDSNGSCGPLPLPSPTAPF